MNLHGDELSLTKMDITMRRLITLALIAVAVITSHTSSAQSAKMVKLDGSNVVPTTTISATITVKRESIRSGPYARFAQEFLGVVAPLTNKDIYTIVDSRLSYTEGEVCDHTTPYADISALNSCVVGVFPKVTEDRLSSTISSTEDMARSAVNTIFSLRRSRVYIITGEVGEFNAGLEAALTEITRLESEILALFLGKQTISYETKLFNIVPEKGKNTDIIARFSETNGIVSENDLSGQPIVLRINVADESVSTTSKQSKKAPKYSETFLKAAKTTCQLFNGTESLTKADIQIFQLGERVEIATPQTK